jgi:hypothetical protein
MGSNQWDLVLHLYVSAALLLSAPALAEPQPSERIRILLGECFWGDLYSCHELEQLNMQVMRTELHDGVLPHKGVVEPPELVETSQPELHDRTMGPLDFYQGVVARP